MKTRTVTKISRKKPKPAQRFHVNLPRHINRSSSNQIEADESSAIELTAGRLAVRKLFNFSFHDKEGYFKPVEFCTTSYLFITGLIYPFDCSSSGSRSSSSSSSSSTSTSSSNDDDSVKVECKGFGPITSWSISGYEDMVCCNPVIWVSTSSGKYECINPSNDYKEFFHMLLMKARLCIEVYKVIVMSSKKQVDRISLDDLVTGVVQASRKNKCFPQAFANRDFFLSAGDFIYKQLGEIWEKRQIKLRALPALIALRDENIRRKITREGICAESEVPKVLQESLDSAPRTRKKNHCSMISQFEILEDYPPPACYESFSEEKDEQMFLNEEQEDCDIDDLPKRILHDWSLYDFEKHFIPLEMLFLKPCAISNFEIFGSGRLMGVFNKDISCSGNGNSSFGETDLSNPDGVLISLNAIREWEVKIDSLEICISIRTDTAWYRMGEPSDQYKPWYEPVRKPLRVASTIIAMLKREIRVSRLSFSDVIRKVSELKKDHPSYIASNIASVQRYVEVHGQTIMHPFAEHQDKLIQRCPFITVLLEKVEERRYFKQETRNKLVAVEEYENQNAESLPVSLKLKAIRSTMTTLMNMIWTDYYSNYLLEDAKDGDDSKLKESDEIKEQEQIEARNIGEYVLIEDDDNVKLPCSMQPSKQNGNKMEIRWEGKSTGNLESGEALYVSAVFQGDLITVGGSVMVETDEGNTMIAFVEYMFENLNGEKMFHGRLMKRGFQTVLLNAANEGEIFLTNECMEFKLEDVCKTVKVDIRLMPWGHEHRRRQASAYLLGRKMVEERKKEGLPLEFLCKSLYCPEKGAFVTLPYGKLGLGTGYCSSCRQRELEEYFGVNSSLQAFVYKNIEYNVGDYLYVKNQHFNEATEELEPSKAKRSNGLAAFVVCHLLEIRAPRAPKDATPESTKLKLRRFYRPEDILPLKAYSSDIREIYYSEEMFNVTVEMIEGKCEVREKKDLTDADFPVMSDHIFFCAYAYDPIEGAISQLPSTVKLTVTAAESSLLKKRKHECLEGDIDQVDHWKCVEREERLDTLDIFSGCGGMSEGLQQSGASCTRWAIEYDEAAGQAFCNNHPKALMFTDNCNVILRAIMEKCGDHDDCICDPKAMELASALDEVKLKNLPLPGQVDLICGGPPCQGFSSLNRFTEGNYSKLQCESILAFLSFADYLRPRFFLLENVRNFVSFKKGQMFRLTLASLLEMGYQVRFGILEAGTYGVPQSRKRVFIWAASPSENLPEWPEPMHAFASPELKICLPEGVQYAASRSTSEGAPFRAITVRDTIGDLPYVQNGASELVIDYGGTPVSWFQRRVRGSMNELNDHIAKKMSELNLIRCQHIPKRPGANWHSLLEKKVKLSNGQMADLVPPFLSRTAERHNQWDGVFGRLDWEGSFRTSITDPIPTGKVGMCLHPEQDRIITVRECARSQGFPDSYRFHGNIQNKHRQIGNAVPPPVAYALGRKLKEAVDAKRHSST